VVFVSRYLMTCCSYAQLLREILYVQGNKVIQLPVLLILGRSDFAEFEYEFCSFEAYGRNKCTKIDLR